MNAEELKKRNPEKEIIYSSSRSGGPGGQNVNKVSTKVELRFNLLQTTIFSGEEKAILFDRLKNKITATGDLVLTSQSERTQIGNKEAVTEKFYNLISRALTPAKKRTATHPTFTSKLKRLDEKKKRGTIKKMRRETGNQPE
jgi:ribosome-associated protein